MMKLSLYLSLMFLMVSSAVVSAQTRVECGGIIESEFTENAETHEYLIDMNAGKQLRIVGRPFGDQLRFAIALLDPAGNRIGDRNTAVTENPSIDSGVMSANGNYKVVVANSAILSTPRAAPGNTYWGGVGVYTLFIGCTLRDGTIIEPGDTMPETSPPGGGSASASVPTFSGIGFPGLAPVDFASAVELPLIPATPMTGAITPAGGEILGFQVDANAGDVMALDFSKLSGNLNLGLVVLSANNEVMFQASLVTSESLSTRLTLPSAGQYTIGVFRIDLLPPAAPEATAFQVTGTLNP